jgi:tetratricopeptide (TPR) repeat protein
MLIDLVFSEDNELVAHNYNLVSREKGTVIAWTRVVHPDGKELIYWMRAMPIYDGKGVLLGVVGSVRDITDVADTLLKDIAVSGAKAGLPAAGTPVPEQVSGTFLDRITGRAKAEYRKGVKLFYKEGKNEEAIQCFDRAIAIDPNIPDVWNERGLCLKSLGKFEDAQKSIERALEMVPRDEEFLYNYGEVLETIGILHRQNKILKNAIQSFSAVTEINPNNASAWNHLGVCIKETGRDEESRNAFERARAIIRANKDRPVRRRRDTLI